jgi:homoserine O-acetyltransferase
MNMASKGVQHNSTAQQNNIVWHDSMAEHLRMVRNNSTAQRTSASDECFFVSYERNGAHGSGVLRIPNFSFESGETLPYVDISFQTWGRLSGSGDNAVVVCHALTGNACVSGETGWWNQLVGPGCVIDTERYFVIASNVLGSCYGSSGPSSIGPQGTPYALDFPTVTIRDMVKAQTYLVDALGVRELQLVIGGSLGGMQTWEWLFLSHIPVHHAVVIAAQPAFPPLAIGYNLAMRQAITSDPDWCDGAYYELGRVPVKGLQIARIIGMLTYRSEGEFEHRFGRTPVSDSFTDTWLRQMAEADQFRRMTFAIESYLMHQGEKLVNRFDANSYLYLTKAMDSHDIGRGRGGVEKALGTVSARLTIVGIDSDYLYSADSLKETVRIARESGVRARYVELRSLYGHDAFLVEQQRLGELVFGKLPVIDR